MSILDTNGVGLQVALVRLMFVKRACGKLGVVHVTFFDDQAERIVAILLENRIA